MRLLWREIVSVSPVLLVPLLVLLIFPYRAIGFKAVENSVEASFQSFFVTLSDDDYSRALRNARVSWQNGHDGRGRGKAHLSIGDLPPLEERPVLGSFGISPPRIEARYVESSIPAWSPSVAAEAPRKLKSESILSERAFSRSELLNINN